MFRNLFIISLTIGLCLYLAQAETTYNNHQKVTFLTYYRDFIDITMGLLEEVSLEYLLPTYQFIKSHNPVKYIFFTLLITFCVSNILGNFHYLQKQNKKVRFVANDDVPKNSKVFQKQIKELRETISNLKQQILLNPTGSIQQLSKIQDNVFQNNTNNKLCTDINQVQQDTEIEQRIYNTSQKIDNLKFSFTSIVEYQKEMQKSVMESQIDIAMEIYGIRTNKQVKINQSEDNQHSLMHYDESNKNGYCKISDQQQSLDLQHLISKYKQEYPLNDIIQEQKLFEIQQKYEFISDKNYQSYNSSQFDMALLQNMHQQSDFNSPKQTPKFATEDNPNSIPNNIMQNELTKNKDNFKDQLLNTSNMHPRYSFGITLPQQPINGDRLPNNLIKQKQQINTDLTDNVHALQPTQ